MNTRKIISFFLAAVVVSVIFVGIPLLFISLNNYFGLPVYTSIYFKIIGSVLLIAGLSIVIYSTILHIKTGRITPLPVIEQPKQFIVHGLYNYCRNPMYLAEVVVFLGLFFLLGYVLLLLYPLLAFLTIHIFVVYVEEPELKRVFGEEYVRYTTNVSRWIPNKATSEQ